MICPTCHREIPDTKVLCPHCGEFLLSDELQGTTEEQEEALLRQKQQERLEHFTVHIEDDADDFDVNEYAALPKSAPVQEPPKPKDYGFAPAAFPNRDEPSSTVVEQTVVKKVPQKKPKKRTKVKKTHENHTVETERVIVKEKKSGCGCGCITAVFLFFIGLFLTAYLVVQFVGLDTIKNVVTFFQDKDVSVSVDVNDKPSEVPDDPPAESAAEPETPQETDEPTESGGKWDSVFEDLPEQ